jgi:hypothetical protein
MLLLIFLCRVAPLELRTIVKNQTWSRGTNVIHSLESRSAHRYNDLAGLGFYTVILNILSMV